MKKLIVGNWKMNPQSEKEAEVIFKAIMKGTKNIKNIDIAICSPYVFIKTLKKLKSNKISLGAQNAFYETTGAYTGEVSLIMLHNIGVKYVIVGHSERRSMGETNEIVNKKLNAILAYLNFVKDQLVSCLSGISKNQIKNIVIAYEPIWALSSTADRHDATPHDFEEMRIYIRKILNDMFSPLVASSVRIIYGGSVNKDNAQSFLLAGAQGLLPGKASLDPKNFLEIINIANSIK